MSPATDRPDPNESESSQDLTTDELDDLIWDIAVGRPTRVVLDTATKRARSFAVHKIIREAVAREHIIEAPS
ncbi:MAG: hypothetical protein U9N78_11380 [Actinomycetota bacterium]|nr:hypothetical protein [Actinomycetota bacterium]